MRTTIFLTILSTLFIGCSSKVDTVEPIIKIKYIYLPCKKNSIVFDDSSSTQTINTTKLLCTNFKMWNSFLIALSLEHVQEVCKYME